VRCGVRGLLGVIGLTIGVTGAGLVVVPELRTFALLRIAPAHARDALLVRLRGANGDVFLLGTIHGGVEILSVDEIPQSDHHLS
jgi:hypothetical protein